MGDFVQLQAADGFAFPAYVARPAGKPTAALVVLQEIFGVNSHIRAVADGYAADGYLVVAPSTFHRIKHAVELAYTPDDISAGAALKAAVEGLPRRACYRTFRPPLTTPLRLARSVYWAIAGVVFSPGAPHAC